MDYNAEDILRVRIYVNDKSGDVFSDAEITEILSQAGCFWCAIADLWELRAVKVSIEGERGYSVGTEKYDSVKATDMLSAAHRNADYFRKRCACTDGLQEGTAVIIKASADIGRWS